jgi:signal transduction histidine kinase
MLGKTFYDFFPENIADEMKSTDETVLHKGEVVETDIVVPVGEVLRNYHSAKFPLYDENNAIFGVCVFTTDTTDSVKMEAEKTSLENQLFHAQKMQAIGQLTGGIAHDFNNLLAVILGYTELSQIKYSNQEGDLKHYLQAIESAGIRDRELVEQMMIYSRKDHIETSSIRIEPILEDTKNMLKATFPASIDIQTSISPNMPSVQCHSGLLSQVLMNLCINAKDSMGTEGCLSVSLFVDNVCRQCLRSSMQLMS